MSIRSEALRWLSLNFGNVIGRICTSKYYLPEESWPKTRVWWLQIPPGVIEFNSKGHIHLVCQVAPGESDFYYLKVPIEYLYDNLEKFHRIGDKVDLYLSANPDTLFVEERGTGELDFIQFLIS